MTRRLLNFLAVLSLLLCVAAVTLWARSYQVRDTLTWERNNMHTLREAPSDLLAEMREPPREPHLYREVREITCARGGVRFRWEGVELILFSGAPWPMPGFTHESREIVGTYPRAAWPRSRGTWLDWSAAGFEAVAAREGQRPRARPVRAADFFRPWWAQRSVTVPIWSLAVASGLLPAVRLGARLRRREASRAGVCRSCGYDLRATPERCPECGAGAQLPPVASTSQTSVSPSLPSPTA